MEYNLLFIKQKNSLQQNSIENKTIKWHIQRLPHLLYQMNSVLSALLYNPHLKHSLHVHSSP
jgi:hypothetical protein